MVSAYRVTVLAATAAAAIGSLPVHVSATAPRLLRGLVDGDDGTTPHYWVSPLIDDPIDKACYRRTYRGRPCPHGYDWDGALACWAQCPLEYPVECGAECLQHNRACTKEILDKAGAVATTALNALTAGVFGQLAATSHAVKLGVTCTNKMLPAVRHIVEFVASSATTPTAQDAQFRKALNEQDFFTKDLPAAIAVCMGREPPSSAGPSASILKVMQTIVDKVIEGKRKDESILRDGSFLDFLEVVGLGFSRERQRKLRSAFGWDDAKSLVESGVSCGQNIKSVVDNITEIVKNQKQVDSSSTLQSIRYAVMNSDVFLRELPDTVLGCANASTPDAVRLRDKILKTAYAIVDQVLDAAVTPSGKPRSVSDFLVSITDMGLDALSSFDPTGLASMVKEFVQPICNPTIFPRSIDDGPASVALGLRTVETAFAGSSGHWYTTEPDPATDTESSVQIIFRSKDDRDVTVEIKSGGNDYDKVKVPSGKTVTWSKPLAELQAKTIYMVRSRPGFLWIKGTGGGSLLAWVPEVPIAGTGTVKLDIKINPPSEKEEMVSLALLEEARAEAAVVRRNGARNATTQGNASDHDDAGIESIGDSNAKA